MLYDTVKKTAYIRKIISPHDRIIVSLSGGADSVCLLHVLRELKDYFNIELFAFHLNHRIRGLSAQKDALFCMELCEKLEIPLFMRSEDVPSYAKQKKYTLEEGARYVRYSLLFDLKKRLKANKIAVAHNQDDQAETVFMRIMRGTGLTGLKGMEYMRPDGIIRPLLDVSRNEIENYLTEHKVKWCTDETNFENEYTRNKIRLDIFPMLESVYPKVKPQIAKMANVLRDDSNYLDNHAHSTFTNDASINEDGTVSLDLEDFMAHSSPVRKREIRFAAQKVLKSIEDIETVHLDDVMNLAYSSKGSGQLDLPRGLKVYKRSGALYFTTHEFKIEDVDFSYALDENSSVFIKETGHEIECKVMDKDKCTILPTGMFTKAFDKSRIKGNLIVRNKRPGDRIHPMGMEGTKKLKDIFIDEKIPPEKRGSIPIICDSDNRILWIVGSKISEDFKIDENTEKVIRISVKKKMTINK